MLNNKQAIEEFLNVVKDTIIQEQTKQGRVASGKSIDGYDIETADGSGTLYGVNYVGTLETGRKAGKIPQGLRFIIRQWMDDKSLFSSEKESKKNSIAYLIARKIANEGTALYRSGGNSGVISNAINEQALTNFSSKILSSFQNETLNELVIKFND